MPKEETPRSTLQAIAEGRADVSDRTIFGFGEDKFREFQEERKQSALRADKEDLSRELSVVKVQDGLQVAPLTVTALGKSSHLINLLGN